MPRARRHRNRQPSNHEACGSPKPPRDNTGAPTGPPCAQSRWLTAGMLALPALTAAAVFANTLANDFVYDDAVTLGHIPEFSMTNVWHWLHRSRGLTYTVHSLDKWLWGDWAPGFHLTNVALHAVASSLAACLALVLTSRRLMGLFCGLLFAVHPVHVEVVASFSYRKDALAMIFVMLGMILWLGRRRPVLGYTGSVLCLLLGLLSKEVAAIGLVPMLFIADLLPGHGHPNRWPSRLERAACRALPFLVLGAIATTRVAGNVADYFTAESIHQTTGGELSGYREVLATTAGSIPDVARLLFVPLTLSADYPLRPPERFMEPRPLAGVALIALWSVATLLLVRRKPVAAFAMAWTLLTYLPCSNVVPITEYFVAERYLYVPSFGVCLLAAVALQGMFAYGLSHDLAWLRVSTAGVAALLIIAGGVRSVARNRDWRDSYSLWSSATRAGFHTTRVHTALGSALFTRGEVPEAVQAYRRAIQLNSLNPQPHSLLGYALKAQGKLDEAAAAYHEAVRLDPGDGDSLVNLGNILQAQNRLDEAVEVYRNIIRLKPFHPMAHYNLGIALQEQGETGRAIEAYRKAVHHDSTFAHAYLNLGIAAQSLGKLEQAVAAYREVIRIDPTHVKAYVNLGIALKKHGDVDAAIQAYRQGIRIDPLRPKAHYNLGWALYEQSRLDDAISAYREAVRLNPTYARAQAALGDALAAQGTPDEAVEAYNKAIELETRLIEQEGDERLAGELASIIKRRNNILAAKRGQVPTDK